MANWAWPHTPTSAAARIILGGGPFDGEEVAFLPPDTAVPAQIVWAGWFPWGFSAYLYEWHGEMRPDPGRSSALVFRPPIEQADDLRVYRGRQVGPDEIPPAMADLAEMWADGADLLMSAFDVPAEVLWPGL